MQYTVTAQEDARTVKELITVLLHPSSKMLKYLKYQENGILLNGKHVTVRAIVHTGDVLTLSLQDPPGTRGPEPVDLPITILYEDADLVVPSKPGNMPTHPSHDHYRDTVANALAHRYQAANSAYVFRPINRLDRETSGLLLIARSKLAAGRLTAAMQAGEIQKSYLAVLHGEGIADEGEIRFPLHRSAQSIIIREICTPDTPDAEPATTRYRVIARENNCCLVQAFPITGRTHQLRVHFAALGCPILADTLYGAPDARIARQALHAWSLSFPHPITSERITITAPLPNDLRVLIDQCFPSLKGEPNECETNGTITTSPTFHGFAK